MLTLLHRFAALTLTLAVLTWLLPEGSVRRTAMLAAGLMAALCFLEGVQGLLQLPEAPAAPGLGRPQRCTGPEKRTPKRPVTTSFLGKRAWREARIVFVCAFAPACCEKCRCGAKTTP